MDPLNKKLITTKDAGDLSGYTADYLSRLVRSGEILGERTGHTWLIDQSSLDIFLEKQKARKVARAQELADARAKEYRAHQQSKAHVPEIVVSKSYRPAHDFEHVPFRSHAFALSLSVAVVVMGAVGAHSSIIPQVAKYVASVADESVYGFGMTFGDIPSHLVATISSAYTSLHAPVSYGDILPAGVEYGSSALLTKLGLESPQEELVEYYRAPVFASAGTTMHRIPGSGVSFQSVQTSVLDTYAFLTTPADIGGSLIHIYVSIGTTANSAIAYAFSQYKSFITQLGSEALNLAYSIRGSLRGASHFIDQMNLALGTVVIDIAHAAIRADVLLVYWLAESSKTSSETAFTAMSTTGSVLAYATAKVPPLVASTYLYATAIPASLAPAITQKVFAAEYTASMYFVASANFMSRQYLALVEGTGHVLYAGVVHAPSLLKGQVPSLASVFGWAGSEPTFKLSTW